MTPEVRVWLVFHDDVRMGPGRAGLLEAIDELGSITAAAERCRMSYRHVWGHLRALEAAAGFQLIVRTRGRGGTGGATLTPRGKALVARYWEFQRRTLAAAEREYKRVFRPA